MHTVLYIYTLDNTHIHVLHTIYTHIIHYTRFEYIHVCHAVPRPQVQRSHTPTSAAGGGQV